MTIHQSICAILSKIEAIGKDRDNKQQGYKFRGIDDIYNSVHPLFAEVGVFSVPTVLDERTEDRTSAKGNTLIYRVLKIKYTFFAADGTFIDAVVIGEGMDSGDKASNKAMAVAHKYAICQILSIPTNDAKDPENDSHDVKAKPVKPETKSEPKPDLRSLDYRVKDIKAKFALAKPVLGEQYNTIMAECEKDYGVNRTQWSLAELEAVYAKIETALKEVK